jgi:hypothetical protein
VRDARRRTRKLYLDGRIPVVEIGDAGRRSAVLGWLKDAAAACGVSEDTTEVLKGAVFEVRQGYKSKDSKRQNADIANATHAYASLYLPVMVLLSTQIDSDIEERYVRSRWLVLKGSLAGSPLDSTYVFSHEVLGYDLAGFFKRNSKKIKGEVKAIIKALLR